MMEMIKQYWHPVGPASALTAEKPIAATVLGEDLVIWRSKDRLCAWKDLCVHRGVRLSLGTVCNNRLRCAYHGWEYNDAGQCEHIPAHPDIRMPAKARATAIYQAREHAGLVWVNLGDASRPLPDLPQFNEPGYRVIPCGPYEISAAAPRVVENFLDLSHPPILHDGILGVSSHAVIDDYRVEDTEEGFSVKNVRYYQPDPDGTGTGGDAWYDFGILAPLTVYFVKHIGGRENKEKFVLMFAVRPESENKSWAHFIAAYNYAADLSEQDIADFHSLIIGQDIPILESQRPELLPVDLSEELHLRSDLFTSKYRRHLKDLGMDFGVA